MCALASLLLTTFSRAAADSCDSVPKSDFCICTNDAECRGNCFLLGESASGSGICIQSSKSSPDPCHRSQNDQYHPGDCILQSRRENYVHSCDGAHFNLDLYTKSLRPGDNSFSYYPKECVVGFNMLRVPDQTVDQCKQLCVDLSSFGQECVAFEYGVSHGGNGLSTSDSSSCDMAASYNAATQPAKTTTGTTQVFIPLRKALLGDFSPCNTDGECTSGGCFNLQTVRRRLRSLQQQQYQSGKICANPASFRNSGPDSVCQFPFVFRGQTFTSCIILGDPNLKSWCSTKVNPISRGHVSGGGYIHYCRTLSLIHI